MQKIEESKPGQSQSSGSFSRVVTVARRNFARQGRQAALPILTVGTGAMLIFVTQIFTAYLRSQAEQIASLFGSTGNSQTILTSTYWISTIVLIIGALEALIVITRNVYRRTREIGIMKAIGVSPRTISSIIMVETFFYGALGGVVGLFGGFVILLLLAVSQLSLDPILVVAKSIPQAALYSFVLAVVSSVLAGLYPSFRAVRLSVLQALAYEG
jgi:ABC-type antimicrobial peptide transport system permease subunit